MGVGTHGGGVSVVKGEAEGFRADWEDAAQVLKWGGLPNQQKQKL